MDERSFASIVATSVIDSRGIAKRGLVDANEVLKANPNKVKSNLVLKNELEKKK